MDTLVGYVSYVFDAETIKLRVTSQDHGNEFVYDSEEKVRLINYNSYETSSAWRSIADIRLIEELLYKKIELKVEKRNSYELIGQISILELST
jgi:hypothetical protein